MARFIGSPQTNFLTGAYAAAYDAATIGIRPEHLRIGISGTRRAVVRTLEHLGNEALVHAQLEDKTMLIACCSENVQTGPGETVAFSIDPALVHRFDRDDRSLHPTTTVLSAV